MYKRMFVISLLALICQYGFASPEKVLPRDWIIERDISLEVNDQEKSQFLNIIILRRHPDSGARTIYLGTNNAGGKKIPVETLSARRTSKDKLLKILNHPQYSYEEILNSPERFNLLFAEVQKTGRSLGRVSNRSADRGLYSDDQVDLAGHGTTPRIGPLKEEMEEDDRIIVQREITIPGRDWSREVQYSGALFFYPTEIAWRFFSVGPASQVFLSAKFTRVDIAGNESTPADADLIVNQPHMGFRLENSEADTRARVIWKSK